MSSQKNSVLRNCGVGTATPSSGDCRPNSNWQSSYWFFALCASLYLLPFMGITVGPDEGTFLYGAVRIIQGQIFARDFFESVGPGSFYWLAAFYKLFGVTFLASRICLFLTTIGTAMLMYFLTRQLCTRCRPLPSLIVAATYFGAIWPGISHHVDSNFFALLAVASLVIWHRKPNMSLLLVAGGLAAITTWIHQPKGIFLLGAFVAWIWFQEHKPAERLAASGLLLAGYFAVISLGLAYFWSKGALRSLYYANVVFPMHDYGTVNRVDYAHDIFRQYLNPWIEAGAGWPVGIGAVLTLPALFVAALPLSLFFIGILDRSKPVAPVLILYWLSGWAFWFSEIHRQDIFHLALGSPLLVIACMHALTESSRKTTRWAIEILTVSSLFLALFNCAIVMAADLHAVPTRVGKVALPSPDTVLVLKFLNEHVPPDENVYVYPYSPAYYFLARLTNPTPISVLVHNFSTVEQFTESVNQLERKQVKYVVWDTNLETRKGDRFLTAAHIASNDLIMEPYLESHYKQIEDHHGILILERVIHTANADSQH